MLTLGMKIVFDLCHQPST